MNMKKSVSLRLKNFIISLCSLLLLSACNSDIPTQTHSQWEWDYLSDNPLNVLQNINDNIICDINELGELDMIIKNRKDIVFSVSQINIGTSKTSYHTAFYEDEFIILDAKEKNGHIKLTIKKIPPIFGGHFLHVYANDQPEEWERFYYLAIYFNKELDFPD